MENMEKYIAKIERDGIRRKTTQQEIYPLTISKRRGRGSGRGGGIDPLNKKITIVRKEFGLRVICKKNIVFLMSVSSQKLC